MKTCNKCKIIKNDVDFSPSNLKRSGGRCKLCCKQYHKEYQKIYYLNNKPAITEKHIVYRSDNKPLIKEINSAYRKNNLAKIKNYCINNKEKIKSSKKQYVNLKYKENINFRLRINTSRAINIFLKRSGSSKGGKSIMKYLPYSFQELKEYFEKQFEYWMNWNNWGIYNKDSWDDNDISTWTWQIDHIIPQSILPYTSMEDDNFKKCWALSNLRPYSAKQNIIDGNRKF